MKKVIQVTTVPYTLYVFLLPFPAYFRARGWQVDALASDLTEEAKCANRFDHLFNITWSRNPFDLSNMLKAPGRVREVIEQGNYDIVHVHTPIAAFVTRLALRTLRKSGKPKLIYTAHGFHFYKGGSRLKNFIFRTLESMAAAWTDYLVVINHEDHEAASHFPGLRPGGLRYMPGIGVDMDFYTGKTVSDDDILRVRNEMNLKADDKFFLMIAEFIPRKHHKDVLDAFAKLQRPNAHLALAGDGRIFEQIKAYAQSLGIADRVHFLGWRRDIPTLIKASISTILISRQEGLPRSIMESFCLSTPVIGTDIRGIRDLAEGDCGILVQVGQPEEITKAMEWMLDHPEETAAMGQRGYEKISADYELKHILGLYEDLYKEALGQVEAEAAPNTNVDQAKLSL
jgi:glycosyltransferase involved in cell wall biosynthesis